MELWFSDYHTDDVKLDIKIEKQLFGEDTDFQRIDVFDSKEFGRFIACDGTIVFSQKYEFIYDEMIVHVPMAVHPHVKKVLVIGGGDGGVARELSRYPEIEELDVVETDHVFIDVCRDFFPDNAVGLDDARVTIFNANGLRFLRSKVNEYDLIINDAIDPLGHAAGLFTKEFYGNCFKALHEDGIMVNQHESPFYQEDAYAMQRAHKRICHSFPISRVYQVHIPTYPSGHWLFGFASRKYHPVKEVNWQAWKDLRIRCRYYNCPLHAGSFALPNYVEELLRDVED